MMTSSRPRRLKVRVGDIFRIPVDESLSIYGQILTAFHRTHLVVVFEATSEETLSIEEVIRRKIDLAGIVFDAKFINGDWPIVGNLAPVVVNQPWFVSGHEAMEDLSLTSIDTSTRHRVTAQAAVNHQRLSFSTPMVLQRAVAGLYNRGPWQEEYHARFRDLARELAGGQRGQENKGA